VCRTLGRIRGVFISGMRLRWGTLLMRLVRRGIMLGGMLLFLMGLDPELSLFELSPVMPCLCPVYPPRNLFGVLCVVFGRGLMDRGGKSQVDPTTQIRALGESQLSTDRGVSALLSNYRNQTPLVLIIGNKCRVSPVSLLNPLVPMVPPCAPSPSPPLVVSPNARWR